MSILVDGSSVRFIDPNTFTATTANGATVIFAYHQCVAAATPDGSVYLRMKLTAGDVGRRVDAQLAELALMRGWNGAMSVNEMSEREWVGVEKMLGTVTA